MSNAYNEAKRVDGKHYGWYLRQQELKDAELEKGLRSFERLIARHEAWLTDPATKVQSFYGERIERQQALIAGWQQDIKRHREFIDILRGILKERKNG